MRGGRKLTPCHILLTVRARASRLSALGGSKIRQRGQKHGKGGREARLPSVETEIQANVQSSAQQEGTKVFWGTC